MKARGGPRQPSGGRQRPGPRHGPRTVRRDPPETRDRAAEQPSLPTPRRAAPRPKPAAGPRDDASSAALAAATTVQTVTVSPDEAGMRVDRFLEARFPGLSFSHIQRIIRKGEVRVNGKRADSQGPAGGRPGGAHPAAASSSSRSRARPAARPTRRRAPSSSRSRCTRTTTCWCSTSRWGSRCRAAPAPPPPRRHARGAARPRRPAAAPRAPARQGHGRLPAGRQDALCRGRAGEDLPLALGAQDLLGAGRRRAAAAAGADLDLPRQGGARGGELACASPSTARRARATP